MERNSEEYQQMRDKALSQLRSGESLTGKDGAFGPLFNEFLEAALDGEMSSHPVSYTHLDVYKRQGDGRDVQPGAFGNIFQNHGAEQ